MGKPSPPPPPDYSGVAAASQKSAELSFQLGQDQLAWAKDQYAQNKDTADKVINAGLKTQALNDATAAKDRARYEKVYQPLEDSLVSDAQSFSSPERKELEAGRAQAAVSQQMDGARQAATQQLESFGIDPSSTRYAALDVGVRAQGAAASAAAGNQAREYVDATGRALRSEAINVGRGYPGQIAAQYGTAMQAGNQSVNSGNSTTATGAATMGTPTQWQGLGNQAVGTWGNTLNMGYQNQLSAYNAEQNQSSGIGSALGLAGGLASSFMKFEDGGKVPALASPTQGGATDDVPARLNVGEFVLPKDTVAYYGEKHIQNMIMKARKAQGNPDTKPAAPDVKPALPAPTTFDTTRSAIPTR